MNCMEAQSLVEDALDKSLAGNRKLALDLHLSRCDACRTFFDREREEHRRWFQALNAPEARRHLPDRFSDDFMAGMAARHAAPQRRWAFAGMLRRIAAMLLAMLLFAGLSYAAVVAGRAAIVAAASGDGDGASGMDGAYASYASADGIGDQPSIQPAVNGQQSADSHQLPAAGYPLETAQGESTMIRKKAAAAALSAAMAASPLAAANGDEYQFIISGDPVAAATAGSSSVSSDAIALETGAFRIASAADGLEARSRSKGASVAIALNATKFRTFIMTFR